MVDYTPFLIEKDGVRREVPGHRLRVWVDERGWRVVSDNAAVAAAAPKRRKARKTAPAATDPASEE